MSKDELGGKMGRTVVSRESIRKNELLLLFPLTLNLLFRDMSCSFHYRCFCIHSYVVS